MKPGDLVKINSDTMHAYIKRKYRSLSGQIMTVVEIVEPDVDVPEHIIVLTEEGLKKVYKDHVELIDAV